MRKAIFPLLLAILCCQFASAQTKDTTGYNVYAYMKVKPGMYSDYLKLEKAWKKIHLANKKAGKLTDWSLSELVSPVGAANEYDFVCRNRYVGAAALDASFNDDYMPDNWKSLLSPEEIALVNRTEDIRTMVKMEVWTVEENSVLWAADADTKAKIFVFNYFTLPEGKSTDDHTKMEMDIWKPVHAARMKDGQIMGWLVLNLELPLAYATSAPYQCATIDVFADLKQMFAPPTGVNYLQKIHPNKTRAELWKQTEENGTLVKAEVRKMIDRLAW